MIVFQVKGQSHRLSTLKGKGKDVIKNFSTYSTKYTEDTEALRRQLSQARSKPDPVDHVRTAHYIGVHMMCTIMMHSAQTLYHMVKPLPIYAIFGFFKMAFVRRLGLLEVQKDQKTKKYKENLPWQTGYSPRPPTSSDLNQSLHSGWVVFGG